MRLHPLSAVREAGGRAIGAGSAGLFVGAIVANVVDLVDVGIVFVLAPLGAVLGAAYGLAYFLRFDYELGAETLAIRSGVVGRTDREIPLRRVQNVDLQQSLLQRALGLAVVRIETAGGGGTEAVLNFVAKGEAERLQREIRERKRGAAAESPDEAGAAAGPSRLFEIDDVELGLYAVSSFRPASVLLLLFALPVGWGAVSAVLLGLAAPLGGPATLEPRTLASAAGLVLAAVGVGLAALTSWAVSFLVTLVGYHGFTLGRAGDDLVYERGLLRRYSGSIPLGKVQRLTITEPVLARRLGYAGLRVETAGYGGGGDGRGSGSSRPASAVPLATRERAVALARAIEPVGELSFSRPPRAARRRYAARYGLVLAALTGLLAGVGVAVGGIAYWYAPLALLPAVPVAAHLKWANRGYALGADHAAFRSGFWRRRTHLVPYYRLQTVETRRTVFQRRLDLASLVADTASSGSLFGAAAVAYDVSTTTGRRLHRELRDRLSAAT